MRLIPSSNPRRLWRHRRSIRSDLPSRALMPDNRFVSEIDFYYRHRQLFGWMRLDAKVPFRFERKRWRSAEACLKKEAGWIFDEPEQNPVEAEKRVMEILATQYAQHAWMRCWLYTTVGLHLRCDNARDVFWGCGATGGGQNRLGLLHMNFRETSVPTNYREVLQPFTYPPKPKRII